MTPTTITELDPFAPDERTAPPLPRLRRIAVLGAFALGGIVGSVAGITAAGGESSNAVVPASAPSTPANTSAIVDDARFGRADATARRMEAERQQRVEACTNSPRSADSVERCILGSDLQSQQLKEYQGGVGRVM